MPPAILARLILLEARRGGLPWMALGGIAVTAGLAAFLSQVALTEGRALQAAILASLLRIAAVFLVAVQVASVTLREQADKGLELFLSLPLSRTAQYLGRLAGHVACGTLLAAAFAAALLPWAQPGAVLIWGGSLALETALVAAVALFFAMSLAQFVPAIAATAGLYLLARTIPAIQAIAAGPGVGDSMASRAAGWCVDGIAFLLPRLDRVTRSEWLLYPLPPAGDIAPALAAVVLYAALLAAAGLVDFHRRNF